MRGSSPHIFNTETLTEMTGPPTGNNESFSEELIKILPKVKPTEDISNALSCYDEYQDIELKSLTINADESNEIKAYFTNMEKPSDLSYSEYLHIAHDINALNKSEDKVKDCGINVSDFLPEPRSLSQILKMTASTKEKWGEAIKSELMGLFDSDTFSLTEKPLPADEIIPT